MITYIIIIGIVIALLIALILIKPKKSPKSTFDKIEDNPKFQEMKSLYEAMAKLNEDGTEEDTIPEGFGEFGHSVTNPIPVNTIMGSMSYLENLRTSDGEKVQHERKGSTNAPNIEKPIDIYDILNNGEVNSTLYISPYNKKNSQRSPKGFKLSTSS